MCFAVSEFNADVSPTAVEPAALAGSDATTRPAAPRSALRTKDFMREPHLVAVSIVPRHNRAYAVENELKMNSRNRRYSPSPGVRPRPFHRKPFQINGK